MFIAFKTHSTNPNKPDGMPNEWPRGTVVQLGPSSTAPDQSGEWIVMTELEFEGYKAIHRPAFNAYQQTVGAEQEAKGLVRKIVSEAISFGSNLIIDFATENVLMGITQAGKTKEVADYLADVMRYAQSGSLYEVLAEVNRLQTAGLPAELAPFVTTDRMNEFKLKIEQYLGIA